MPRGKEQDRYGETDREGMERTERTAFGGVWERKRANNSEEVRGGEERKPVLEQKEWKGDTSRETERECERETDWECVLGSESSKVESLYF